MNDQKALIEAVDWDWLFWFDGARYDFVQDVYDEYVDGDLMQVWNHNIGYTGDWAVEMLTDDFAGKGLFSPVPLRSLQHVDFDGRDHFDVAPEYDDDTDVADRLAALGYKEQSGDVWRSSSHKVNAMVREHDVDGGVIRYLDPHPPLDGLEEMTSGSSKTEDTATAIESGDLTVAELYEAYERSLRGGFEAMLDLLPGLDGTVVVTADHGECLYDCEQLWHARGHVPHDHLVHVPWLEVDR